MARAFVLMHSPLAGPCTWSLVARDLEAGGHTVIVPELRSPQGLAEPYYRHHVEAVAKAVEAADSTGRLILVGHSGAGPLLPAIGAALDIPVEAYIFVDAALPTPGHSRLDGFGDEAAVRQFRESARDGLVPPWPEAALRPLIPDDAVRARFVEDLQPMPLAVYEEPLPVVPGWPEARCAYLRFSDAYLQPYVEALRRRWLTRQIGAGHFHMLENPRYVAGALLELSATPVLPRD
jgi:pimeloyl-ACP methyl ester carboxylesterase